MIEIARTFLRLSFLGFGGPNAHISLMLEEVVERRGWLTREHFLDLLAITHLLPGPNSSEMAIHVGFVRGGHDKDGRRRRLDHRHPRPGATSVKCHGLQNLRYIVTLGLTGKAVN